LIDNTPLLKELLASGEIRLNDNPMLYDPPSPIVQTAGFDKVEGMLMGLAVGDALGATSEGMVPEKRKSVFEEIRDYIPGRRSNYKRIGIATDDTQLSFRTVEQLMEDGGLDPDHLARKFCRYKIRGSGSTTKQFVSNYKDDHMPWRRAGIDSLGNGALMRMAPVLLPYLRNPSPSLFADAALDCMITHNAFANTASCVAFVKMLWALLDKSVPPEPAWWIDEFCAVLRELEGETRYHHDFYTSGSYDGPLWRYTRRVCRKALAKGSSVREACDSWGSGASLFETVPSVLYILATQGHNAEEAIVRAVNDTKDNDTIAAIVGAAVGALHGIAGIPERWLRDLSGSIRAKGPRYQVFRLTMLAKKAFWLDGQEKN
jgi:ADP-ribosyl-[dinitrogen reductase] hydrolase